MNPNDRRRSNTLRPNSTSERRKSLRPFVLVNMAMTADGKIATANRAVTSFGSPRDLAHLYELRATADALLCGARTVEQSQATLGNGGERYRKARLRRGLAPYPVRVLVSGSGSVSPDAPIWAHRFSPIIVLTTTRAGAQRLAVLRKLADHVWVGRGTEVDFGAALRRLRREFGVQRLVVEGGGEVNDAFFRAGLVDELNLTLCPLIFGGKTAPTIADGIRVPHLAAAAPFVLQSRRRHGDEVFLVYRQQVVRSSERSKKLG
jgi:2,5-diamino-6-(ribosylamino)-4(3H)-pyrimidinone 5'-phosphate reductase